jgi:acetyltransferase-like isoleucine patch superfamily enzyme
MGVTIHPMALVGDVLIGDGSRIWQFASVIRGSVLGKNCNIGSCSIVDGVEMGDNCLVSHGASLNPGLVVGSNVFFGPNCTICNDRRPAANKDGFDGDALLDGFVTVRIGDGASIGANAVVLPGVTIGAGAMVAAGAVVRRDLAPGHLLSRAGYANVIPAEWRKNRMREAA